MSVIARVRGGFAGILAGLVVISPGFAQTLPKQVGPTILTVTGLDPAQHPGGQVAYDLAMLEALPQSTISTTSIWTDGLHDFTGVPLAALATQLQLSDTNLRLHALNDYSVDFPLSETEEDIPILAYKIDGALMPVRDKGPIWIIYPFDKSAEYRTDTIYSRSVWQLDRIEVLR